LGKLIAVVGNTGIGKTIFVRHLCKAAKFSAWLEQNEERPFQERFSLDNQKYALANQIDFLIFRAEQEISIRNGGITGVQDGGLDQDFFVFTRLFYRKGYLTKDEYALCESTYAVIREMLPPPDLIIWLRAPLEVITERYNRRGRGLSIAGIEDMEIMEALLEDWLGGNGKSPLFVIDSEAENRKYAKVIPKVIDLIQSLD
jgi:deoxyadenosine/deoxycytidine kinase